MKENLIHFSCIVVLGWISSNLFRDLILVGVKFLGLHKIYKGLYCHTSSIDMEL